MLDRQTSLILPGKLEIRQDGEGIEELAGAFPYDETAIISDRGSVRKERFGPDAFGWQIREFAKLQRRASDEIDRLIKEEGARAGRKQAAKQTTTQQVQDALLSGARQESTRLLTSAALKEIRQQLERRNIHLLSGHNFNSPMASLLGRTLAITSTRKALTFVAKLPPLGSRPTYMVDILKGIESGLVTGLSPGFRVPPSTAVAIAEKLIPEPGNQGVMIRQILAAVLYEISLVTRPAYSGTDIDVRAMGLPEPTSRRRVWL